MTAPTSRTELAATTDGELEPIRSKYPSEVVHRGLFEMVVAGGNSEQAADRLAELGHEVPGRTLREWRETLYPRRYAALAEKHAAPLEKLAAQQAREVVLRASQVEMLALEKAEEQLNDNKAKDPAAVARNASTTKGINVTKILELEGRPTVVTEQRSAAEILRALKLRVGMDPDKPAVTAEVAEDDEASEETNQQ